MGKEEKPRANCAAKKRGKKGEGRGDPREERGLGSLEGREARLM